MENKTVGYEKWYGGSKGEVTSSQPRWLYSENSEDWNPTYIYHNKKDKFTGLKDKNKKEIYAGDILRRPAKDAWEKENYGCYEVFFHDGNEAGEHIGFVMNRSHYHGNMSGGCIPGFLPRQTEKMEVIGNIWEDAKLLTEVNK